MLIELEIENLALIRAARIQFAPGLNVLTGETGAGKSLVLRALELIRGGRFEKSQIRHGSESSRVSALFRVPPAHQDRIRGVIEPLDLDGGQLLITRTASRSTEGRLYLNGTLAPLATLRALAPHLIDIVGQGEARLLAEADHRTALLDLYGGLTGRQIDFAGARGAALDLRNRRDRLQASARERLRRLEFLRFERTEIDRVAPEAGELDRLERELSVLEAADQLRTLIGSALSRLYEADDSVNDQVGRLLREMSGLDRGALELLSPAHTALDRAAREVEEAVAVLRSAADGISDDPRRAGQVSDRLDALRRLLDRFGPGEQDLFDHRSRVETQIEELEAEQDDTATLDEKFVKARELAAR
ncbi:MAG: AAA family ATPase, partial [Planctomycetota bacterium]